MKNTKDETPVRASAGCAGTDESNRKENMKHEDLKLFDYAIVKTPLGYRIRHVQAYYNGIPYEYGGYFGRRDIRKAEFIDGFPDYLTSRDALNKLNTERNEK